MADKLWVVISPEFLWNSVSGKILFMALMTVLPNAFCKGSSLN